MSVGKIIVEKTGGFGDGKRRKPAQRTQYNPEEMGMVLQGMSFCVCAGVAMSVKRYNGI